MSVETDTSLLNDYEGIRRREYTLITDILEVLPRINNLPENATTEARDALFHADHPFLMVFVGPFSSGKSSLINALVGSSDLLAVGPVPTTDRISILRWGEDPQRMDSGGSTDTVFHPAPLLKKVSLVDTPGLESVFQKHEDTTRRFLHRSDVVILVMLATQAMTASNVEYIQHLREYGKKVIIVINQVDLLSPEDAEKVRQYVLDQSQSRLGFIPQVWMVSARQGQAARQSGTLDAALWTASGLNQFDDYVARQLGDLERVRQKLQTPLQIMQNVTTSALARVRADQAVLDHYQAIRENVEQQLGAQQREQQKAVRESGQEISEKFGATAMRGSEALREIFSFSQALRAFLRGLSEMVGLARLLRRGEKPSYVREAFERRKTFEPLTELNRIYQRLGPRLEGRDLQDIDDLAKYAQKEIRALPAAIQSKVIGTVQAPTTYDRRALQEVQPQLDAIEEEARVLETDNIAHGVRNAMIVLAVWELLVLVVTIFVLLQGAWADSPQILLVVVVLFLALGMGGLVLMPLAGRLFENQYTNRLLKLQARYLDTLTVGADRQIDYSMRLRRDVVSPLTRLVEAQATIHTEQLVRLQQAEQEMARIETELNKLGKRSILGMRV